MTEFLTLPVSAPTVDKPYAVYVCGRSADDFLRLAALGPVTDCEDKEGNGRLCVNYDFDWAKSSHPLFANTADAA